MVTINDPIYSNTQRKTMHSFPSSVRDVLFVEMHYITRVLVHDTCLQVISNRLLISLHPHGFICSSITSQLFKSPSLGSLINTMPADAWTRPKRGSEKAKNHGFMDTYFPSNGGSSKCKKCGYSLSKCCCKSTTDGKSSKPSSSNSSSRSWVELTHDLHVLFCFRQGLPPRIKLQRYYLKRASWSESNFVSCSFMPIQASTFELGVYYSPLYTLALFSCNTIYIPNLPSIF